eukprot:scaffold1247_cov251-Pinguiococcus_pyrenoidosus.AAC.39
MEKIKAWERAHDDYIRFIEVHPTLPYVLTSSDDLTIKLWDWERNWDCTNVFEVRTFASSSLPIPFRNPHAQWTHVSDTPSLLRGTGTT